MSGGGKGGKQTTEVQIPQWLEDAARANLARASDVSAIGYTPYYGPDVAAMTPMQQAAIQNVNQAASAFGMAAPSDPMAGMPQAQTFAGGVQGYSSAPLYEQSLESLQRARPAQYEAMNAMFIDPVSGAYDYTPGMTMGAGKGGSASPAAPQVPAKPVRDIDEIARHWGP